MSSHLTPLCALGHEFMHGPSPLSACTFMQVTTQLGFPQLLLFLAPNAAYQTVYQQILIKYKITQPRSGLETLFNRVSVWQVVF